MDSLTTRMIIAGADYKAVVTMQPGGTAYVNLEDVEPYKPDGSNRQWVRIHGREYRLRFWLTMHSDGVFRYGAEYKRHLVFNNLTNKSELVDVAPTDFEKWQDSVMCSGVTDAAKKHIVKAIEAYAAALNTEPEFKRLVLAFDVADSKTKCEVNQEHIITLSAELEKARTNQKIFESQNRIAIKKYQEFVS